MPELRMPQPIQPARSSRVPPDSWLIPFLHDAHGGDRNHPAWDHGIQVRQNLLDFLRPVHNLYDHRQILGEIDKSLGGEMMMRPKALDASPHCGSRHPVAPGEFQDRPMQGFALPLLGFPYKDAQALARLEQRISMLFLHEDALSFYQNR